jgi:hypothetical protein
VTPLGEVRRQSYEWGEAARVHKRGGFLPSNHQLIDLVVQIDSIFLEKSQVGLYRGESPISSDAGDWRGRLGQSCPMTRYIIMAQARQRVVHVRHLLPISMAGARTPDPAGNRSGVRAWLSMRLRLHGPLTWHRSLQGAVLRLARQ